MIHVTRDRDWKRVMSPINFMWHVTCELHQTYHVSQILHELCHIWHLSAGVVSHITMIPTLQHTAHCCSVLQCVAVCCSFEWCDILPWCQPVMSLYASIIIDTHHHTHHPTRHVSGQHTAMRCNALQHTATHCNTLQHTATHCNTLQHTATHCNTLQHTAIHCNTLQHTATHYRLHQTCQVSRRSEWVMSHMHMVSTSHIPYTHHRICHTSTYLNESCPICTWSQRVTSPTHITGYVIRHPIWMSRVPYAHGLNESIQVCCPSPDMSWITISDWVMSHMHIVQACHVTYEYHRICPGSPFWMTCLNESCRI